MVNNYQTYILHKPLKVRLCNRDGSAFLGKDTIYIVEKIFSDKYVPYLNNEQFHDEHKNCFFLLSTSLKKTKK